MLPEWLDVPAWTGWLFAPLAFMCWTGMLYYRAIARYYFNALERRRARERKLRMLCEGRTLHAIRPWKFRSTNLTNHKR